MNTAAEVAVVSLLGLGTTSSALAGVAIGLYSRFRSGRLPAYWHSPPGRSSALSPSSSPIKAR